MHSAKFSLSTLGVLYPKKPAVLFSCISTIEDAYPYTVLRYFHLYIYFYKHPVYNIIFIHFALHIYAV